MEKVICVAAFMLNGLEGSGMGDNIPADEKLPELFEVFWQMESCSLWW